MCVLPHESPAPAPSPLPVRGRHGDFLSPVCQGSTRTNGQQVQIRVSKQGRLSGGLPPGTALILVCARAHSRRQRLGEEGALSIFSSCTGTSRWMASEEVDFQPGMGGLTSLNEAHSPRGYVLPIERVKKKG